MFWLYNVFLTLTFPFWGVWMVFRAAKRSEAPKWGERWGNYPFRSHKGVRRIWVHAVSVGEVLAVKPVLEALKSRLPEHEVVLSVTTSSGHRTAREQLEGLFAQLVYFPVDFVRTQLAAFTRVRPEVVVVVETELWFNFCWTARQMDARVIVINGRVSDRSFPKALKVRPFYVALFKYVDRVLAQSVRDAERFRALGAQGVEVFGNCKFDQAIGDLTDDRDWRTELGLPAGRPVVVVGSTRGDVEERFVVEALRRVGADRVAVVHAPRHLERVDDLKRLVETELGGVSLRSKREKGPYVILDTYGELGSVYGAADISIIGGGFDNLGGQNLIQPLAHGVPVLHGAHMQNFRDAAEAALAVGASRACATPEELASALSELLDNPAKREEMGAAAKKMIAESQGASERYARAIVDEAQRHAGG